MPRVNKFVFNILSSCRLYNGVNLSSDKDLQETFIDYKDKQIIYCDDYLPKDDGIFKCVCKVSLFHQHPLNMNFFFELLNHFH
jgi:hypothetical protein